MTTTALITFVLITGFVWGGFAYFASLAMRKERAKVRGDGRSEGPAS